MLPQEFMDRMKLMLGEEFAAFEESCRDKPRQALRVNPLKAGWEEFFKKSPFALREVPWARHGYYYGEKDAPGKHPYHDAGVYYIQEPSAMAPAEYLRAQPGERILDLCAAPGGKSTQIAADMEGEGLLICNEIHPKRAKALSENIERMGVRNAIVTNEPPERLAECLPGYFDRILVDAPCSGEGMFRKNEAACAEWSVEQVRLCAERQDGILSCAAKMLRPGGRLVYSTCTFSPEENEGSVSRFLRRFPEFEILSVEKAEGMEGGRGGWLESAAEGIEKAVRLFPHRLSGEGHFLAVLRKEGNALGNGCSKACVSQGAAQGDLKDYQAFCRENLTEAFDGPFLWFGDQLYLLPEGAPSLRGLRVVRPGLHLGTSKKKRFEPSHALALALGGAGALRRVSLDACSDQASAYLSGQAFPALGEPGWHLIAVDGFGIGWGKLSGGMMKNHYPKGLRKNR